MQETILLIWTYINAKLSEVAFFGNNFNIYFL